MRLQMPTLETDRLLIRPFTPDDLEAAYRIFDLDLYAAEPPPDRSRRAAWLQWTAQSYAELGKLYQLPMGERAVALREGGELIGAVGFNPAYMPFGQVGLGDAPAGLHSIELGMYWGIASPHQGRGYASEAARAMLGYAFAELEAHRVVATTEHTNVASQRVMEKIGMALRRNPLPTPGYFQVVGVIGRAEHAGIYGRIAL